MRSGPCGDLRALAVPTRGPSAPKWLGRGRLRMRKNSVSPNCKQDCENSTDQSSRAPDYLIAKERLTPQIPETVLTPPDHGAPSDHARANRMSRLKATAWVSGDPFHTDVRRQVALYFQQEGTDSKAAHESGGKRHSCSPGWQLRGRPLCLPPPGQQRP